MTKARDLADLNFASPELTGTPTAPTATAGTNTTQVATTAFVGTGIANLVDSSPDALNTLNELAAALGDDANFSTTVTNSIATKAPLASPTFTGNVTTTGSQNGETNFVVTNTNTGADAQVRTKYTTDGGLFTVGKTSDAHAFSGDAYVHNVDNTNIRFATNDTERFRIGSSGELGIGGATYGTSGQVLTSGGSGAAPSWTTISAGAPFSGFGS